MLEQICAHIHNYFTDPEDIRAGVYTIEGKSIDLPFVAEGQYFRIVGSVLNDGVYEYPADNLMDETFTGEIWPMKVPRAVRTLAGEIGQWQTKYGAAVSGPYQSESFGGYSYTLKGGNAGNKSADADAADWRGIFKSRLNEWRKLS